MTPEAAIHVALMEQVEDLSLITSTPLFYREIPADRPQTDYIEVDHLPNANDRLFVTSGRLWRQGILQLTLCSALGQYEAVYRERAGQIAAHFLQNLALTVDGVTIEVTRTDVGRGLAEGAHWRIPISVYYRGFA
jgi:hypothetical protein